MLRTMGGGGLSTSSMLRTGAAREVSVLANATGGLDEEEGTVGLSPISSMLRMGERGLVKGEGERPSSTLGALGFAEPSRRARTSRRSSSSMASMDMGGRDMMGGEGGGFKTRGKRSVCSWVGGQGSK